jgi:2,3-bisphosphoglycerate-dependent phosphoglycerate mutase
VVYQWRLRRHRALQTAEIATAAIGLPILRDERLRDRELGILDLLTSHGVRARLPEEATRRERLGKFYYRPPGGESWADVALRLRSVLGDLRRDYADRRVLLFGHEAIVFLLRYVIEGLTEAQLMNIVRSSTTVPQRLRELAAEATAVAIGPGLDDVDETETLLRAVLDAANQQTALVLDAYALGGSPQP